MADEYFPIRGNEEFEYYFDIWSNIHFGYVGASIGFPTQGLENIPDLYNRVHPLLRDLIKPLLGSNGPGDVISVKIGIALWESHRYGIKKHHIIDAILNETNNYLSVQDTNGNGIIDKQEEVDPNKGPLLPRGWKKFGEIVGDWK